MSLTHMEPHMHIHMRCKLFLSHFQTLSSIIHTVPSSPFMCTSSSALLHDSCTFDCPTHPHPGLIHRGPASLTKGRLPARLRSPQTLTNLLSDSLEMEGGWSLNNATFVLGRKELEGTKVALRRQKAHTAFLQIAPNRAHSGFCSC